eukprot:GHVQ01004350.1.p1 GENE.GHVQ01004350.1~~GHVQ01004350.1.p1  ORF type:complete len:105 (-),score=17.35 GHVQ01004350.1:21-335(-)
MPCVHYSISPCSLRTSPSETLFLYCSTSSHIHCPRPTSPFPSHLAAPPQIVTVTPITPPTTHPPPSVFHPYTFPLSPSRNTSCLMPPFSTVLTLPSALLAQPPT